MVSIRRVKFVFVAFIGFYIGNLIFHVFKNKFDLKFSVPSSLKISFYDQNIADNLLNDVRILCIVVTNPANHKTKAIHIKNTWGRKCNKLFFVTTQTDPELDTIALPLNESKKTLRKKIKGSFLYAHDNHLDEFDWLLKADDDNFILMENLRYMLSQYNPKVSLLFGHRFLLRPRKEMNLSENVEGYMSGSGYILSKKALQKFVELVKKSDLFNADLPLEDVSVGKILSHHAIFVNTLDELQQQRFFPIGLSGIFVAPDDPMKSYYYRNTYYNVSQGSLRCCSDVPIAFHYISPKKMFRFNYFAYEVHPFGVSKHLSEKLPRKLKVKEIIKESDKKVFTRNFRDHLDFHNMTSSEVDEI